jgi:hypothetical protein
MKSTRTACRAGITRRLLLGGAAASLAAGAPIKAAAAAALPSRSRFSIASDFVLPRAETVTLLPLTVTNFQEAPDVVLRADGKLQVQIPGLYRVTLACDWVAQAGMDMDRRMIGIRRAPGHLPNQDDRLASVDIPGSDPPAMARYQGEWTPGTVPLGGIVTTEITVSPAGVARVGDLALASHSRIKDSIIGADAVNGLMVQARVVAPDRVRVILHNPMVAAGITIPVGALNVIAMSAVDTRGESNDAWQVLHTATEELAAGQTIFAVLRSRVKGDYVQATQSTFMQIERVG